MQATPGFAREYRVRQALTGGNDYHYCDQTGKMDQLFAQGSGLR